MKHLIHKSTTLVLIALAALLSACGRSVSLAGVEVGIVPTETPIPTATPVPTPTLTPTPAPALESYANGEYGFAFEYLAHWTLVEEPHAITLSQGTLALRIGYRRPEESVDITGGRSGMPAGDLIYSDKTRFLDTVIPAHTLEYQRKAKAVFYGESGPIEAGDLVFVLWLEDLDGRKYEELDLSKELQAEAKAILESFRRVEAAGQPPAPSPTPAPSPVVQGTRPLNQYINYQVGFSIKIPYTMVSPYGSCKWVEGNGGGSYRPELSYVPVAVFEDGETTYIAGESYHELSGVTEKTSAGGGTRTFFSECQAVTNNLDLLRDPENHYQTRWEIVAEQVRNDAELEAFIRARYGSGCRLGEKRASSQDGVYDVHVEGDGKDLSETKCPLNYRTVVKYYPEGDKVIAWDLGQAVTFAATLDYSVTHDQEMVESFRFLTGTPVAGDDPATSLDVVGWYGSVHSLPAGNQFDDYLSLLSPFSSPYWGEAGWGEKGQVGLAGASPAVEAMIAEMRDKQPPNAYAHFWGALRCDVPDYGGCQLLVTHMRPDSPGPLRNPDPVEGWEGTVITNSAWAQIDDAFVLAGPYPVPYGIWSEDPTWPRAWKVTATRARPSGSGARSFAGSPTRMAAKSRCAGWKRSCNRRSGPRGRSSSGAGKDSFRSSSASLPGRPRRANCPYSLSPRTLAGSGTFQPGTWPSS